jgi:hypothetical protein
MGYSVFYSENLEVFKDKVAPLFEKNMNPPLYKLMYKDWVHDLAREIQDSGMFSKNLYSIEHHEEKSFRVYNYKLIKIWFRTILKIYQDKNFF